MTINPAAPSNLTYSLNPASYEQNKPIVANAPRNSGSPLDHFTINPALPAGLALDPIRRRARVAYLSDPPARPGYWRLIGGILAIQ